MNNWESLAYIPSEAFLACFLIVLLLGSLFLKPERNLPGLFYPIGMAGLAITFVIELISGRSVLSGGSDLFSGLLRADALGYLFKLFSIGSAILFLALSQTARETTKRFHDSAEYVVLTLSLTLGMMLFVTSNNIVMFYLSMELLSFSSYLLTGFVDRDEKTIEAAIKYLLYGAVASGVMIFGLSLIYGLAGTLDFTLIGPRLAENQTSTAMLVIAFAFLLAGLGFKIAVFPFHLWSPDVYEGAPTAFSAFLSVGPKAAGFAALVRVLYRVLGSGGALNMPFPHFDWSMTVAVISAVTMTVGNLAALPQRNIKRMLAYSSIAHAGYALMAIASRSAFGVQATFFYLAVYLLMNVAAFLVVILVANEYYTERLDGYEGLGWKGPQGAFLAASLTIALFSLAGIPPFAGFIGKVYLLLAVIKKGSGMYWLAVVASLNTVISLAYYARVVRLMFLSRKVRGGALSPMTGRRYAPYAVLGMLSAMTVVFGVYWAPLDAVSKLAELF